MSKFDELMTGRTAEQQAEADRRRADRAAAAGEEIPDLPPPPRPVAKAPQTANF